MSRPHIPVTPGDRDRPDWWTEHDDAILAGELAKLEELRPAVVEPVPAIGATPAAVEPRPWRLLVGLVVALLVVVLLALVAAWPARHDGRTGGPVTTPTTYAPPGPRGGFTSMPAL